MQTPEGLQQQRTQSKRTNISITPLYRFYFPDWIVIDNDGKLYIELNDLK